MSHTTSPTRTRRRAAVIAASGLVLLSLTACGSSIETGERSKAANAERERVRDDFVASVQASTSPGLVMLDDVQLLSAGEKACLAYDRADTDDNVLLNFVNDTRAGNEVVTGMQGTTRIYTEAAAETVGAATRILCPQYEERAQLEAEEMDLMGYTF